MDIEKIKESVIVDDGHIILGKPLELMMYGKKVIIKPLNWLKEWPNFAYNLGVFLQYYHIICERSQLPDTLNEINEFRKNIRMVTSNKDAFKALVKICGFAGLRGRWMKKRFSMQESVSHLVMMEESSA